MFAVAVPIAALTRYEPPELLEMDESARLLLEEGELDGEPEFDGVCC